MNEKMMKNEWKEMKNINGAGRNRDDAWPLSHLDLS
jgi:hypothetical protein